MSTTIIKRSIRSQDESGWTIVKVDRTSTTFSAHEFWEGIKTHPFWALLGFVLGTFFGVSASFLLF